MTNDVRSDEVEAGNTVLRNRLKELGYSEFVPDNEARYIVDVILIAAAKARAARKA